MKFLKFFAVLSLLILYGCQINYPLLQPWKNDPDRRNFSWKEKEDSIHLKILGENLQPVFFKNKDSLQRNFTITSYFFNGNNGRKINAWLLQPKSKIADKSVFALHGNAGNLNTQLGFFSNLTDFGFQVFIFDYAGFGYSEGKPTRKAALEDSFSAFEFFRNLDKVKSTSKIIYGQSIGGNFAIPVATQNQGEIAGLVLEGTFLQTDDIANHYFPVLGRVALKNNFDNKLNIKSFKKSVLVIHSNEDKVVPEKLGKKLFENANEPKSFLEIGKCHICGIKFYGEEIASRIGEVIFGN